MSNRSKNNLQLYADGRMPETKKVIEYLAERNISFMAIFATTLSEPTLFRGRSHHCFEGFDEIKYFIDFDYKKEE